MATATAMLGVGDLVRIMEPPEGVSNCKFRGRVGTVMYPLEREGESATDFEMMIVAVERRESERLPRHGVLAENIFEFVPVPRTALVDAKDATDDEKPIEKVSWIAPIVKKRRRQRPANALVNLVGQLRVTHLAARRVAVRQNGKRTCLKFYRAGSRSIPRLAFRTKAVSSSGNFCPAHDKNAWPRCPRLPNPCR